MDHKQKELSLLRVELRKFQLSMKERRFVKPVMPFLVKREEVVVLLRNSDI